MNYFRLLNTLQKGDAGYLDVPVDIQRNYMLSLGTTENDIDRSFKQYQCQRFFQPLWKKVLFNFIGVVIFIPITLILLIKGLFVRRGETLDAYGDFYGIEEIIPNELSSSYIIDIKKWDNNKALFWADIILICMLIIKHPFSPWFVLKCTLKLSIYSAIIRKHTPRAIIVHNEPSFTSSFLTMCCERRGVKHINVMHGEKLYNIRDSYFRFDAFYVWSDYYVELFKSLGVEPTQMRVSVPSSLKIDINLYYKREVYSDYKYYLAIYNEDEIKSIVKSMQFVKESNKTVKYRPHPRYSDIKLLLKYVDKDDIEWPEEVGILYSISNLTFAVGSYTTVLSQVYFSGGNVILDDVTYRERYNKLKEYRYILSNVGLPSLSQLQ